MNLGPFWIGGLAMALAACGASPAVAPAPPTSPPASAAPIETGAVSVAAPAKLAVWAHVENPALLGSFVQKLMGPATGGSCATGNLGDCLAFIDPAHPLDFADVATDSGDDATAVGFSIQSVADFRARAAKTFETTDVSSGLLQIAQKAEKTDSPDAGAPAHADKSTPDLCDIGAAQNPPHRMVCGNKEGLARLAPWLRTAPRPASTEDLARVEIYPGPVVAAADKKFAGDTPRDQELRRLAHDFAGATLKLASNDGAGAPLKLALDVQLKGAESRWTNVLLAPVVDAGAVPDTFARLTRGATAAFYAPGGGPLVAILDQLGLFAALTQLDSAKTKGAVDEVRAVLGRPVICAHVIDFDEARAAIGEARRTSEKNRKKAEAALDEAFGSYFVCGMQETAKAAEGLARKVIDLAPKTPGESDVVRPAANLGLPKGSFMVESKRTPAPAEGGAASTKTPASKKTTDTLVVPDGDTTWVASGEDVHLTARLVKRLLQQPKGAITTFASPSGTLVTGYLSSLFGAFFTDLASHSLDPLEASLANTSPGLLRLALSQKRESIGGTLTLTVESDLATLEALGTRSLPLALLVMGAVAVATASPDAASK